MSSSSTPMPVIGHLPAWMRCVVVCLALSAWSADPLPAQQTSSSAKQSDTAAPAANTEQAVPHPAKSGTADSQFPVAPTQAIPEGQAPVLLDVTSSPLGSSTPTVDDPALLREMANEIAQEKFQEAEPHLTAYLKERPRSSQAHYFYGYLLFRQLRLGDSIRELAKALELNTENGEAHKMLGHALSLIGRYDMALRELDEAGRIMPQSAEVYYNRGRIYSIQDDFHKARTEFEAALKLKPDYVEAYNALGFAMDALGDDDATLRCYQKAVELSEAQGANFDAPYVNLSGFYGQRGDFEASLEYARKALALNPNSDLAYFQMAKTYRTQQDWTRMAEALEKAIAIKPTLAQYHYVLSQAYRKLGKLKESDLELEEFRRIDKETAALEAKRRETRRETAPPNPE